jgi:hypothetical protein
MKKSKFCRGQRVFGLTMPRILVGVLSVNQKRVKTQKIVLQEVFVPSQRVIGEK